MSLKKEAMIFHKLVALSALMIDAIDDSKLKTEGMKEYRDALDRVEKMSELIIADVFAIESIAKGTYFQNLTNQVNTAVRKTFKIIE